MLTNATPAALKALVGVPPGRPLLQLIRPPRRAIFSANTAALCWAVGVSRVCLDLGGIKVMVIGGKSLGLDMFFPPF
jgi:hypothetical protein